MNYFELDWPEIQKAVAAQAQSELSRNLCLQLSALSDAESAKKSIEEILSAQSCLNESALPELSILDSISAVFSRLQMYATLDLKELSLMRHFLSASLALKAFLKSSKVKWAESTSSLIADFKPQLSAINHVVSLNNEINEDASATLQSLSQERRQLALQISKLLDQIVQRRNMQSILQDRFVTNREGRMVIPVKSGSQHDIKGLIHDASQTKQTVFMEPEEAIPLNNRLREVQILIQEEIERILRELSQYLATSLITFQNSFKVLLDCDVLFAKAKFNQKISGQDLGFSSDKIDLKNLKHPLLVLQGIRVVPNDVKMTANQRVLLLSGPNAGGKTVLLKAIGVSAQMARCGLPICAHEGSSLPFFSHLDPIIGDLQSVGENLSSFSSHMARLNHSLGHKKISDIVLIDEICGSTDPEEGAALARSFIDHYLEHDCFAVITSHFSQLKEGWAESSALTHGSLEFDLRTNKPTFQLLLGLPGQSLALSVARRLGTPEALIERAKTYLDPKTRQQRNSAEEVERLKEKLMELKSQVQMEADQTAALKAQYQGLITKFREQRDAWLQKAISQAEKRVERLIEEARNERLKQKTLHDIKADLPEIIRAKPATNRAQTLEEFKNLFKPGTPAFSSRLGRQVIVQSEPDSKGQVLVLADSMRVSLPWHTMSSVQQSQDDRQTIRRPAAAQAEPIEDSDAELDLRGFRVDEALTVLEKWLDTQTQNDQSQLKVIHGFGTEQLKKAIRRFLSKSSYVAEWKAGDPSSGGDGITWITLK